MNNSNNVSNNATAQKKFFDFIVPPRFQGTEITIQS